jgi:hypothetical protein
MASDFPISSPIRADPHSSQLDDVLADANKLAGHLAEVIRAPFWKTTPTSALRGSRIPNSSASSWRGIIGQTDPVGAPRRNSAAEDLESRLGNDFASHVSNL